MNTYIEFQNRRKNLIDILGDGIAIIFNSDEYEIGKGGRNDRGVEEYYTMAYVKKESLQNINTLTKK